VKYIEHICNRVKTEKGSLLHKKARKYRFLGGLPKRGKRAAKTLKGEIIA
jgi:hypothetical protein